MDAIKDRITKGACSVAEAIGYVRDVAGSDDPQDHDIRDLCTMVERLMESTNGSRLCKVLSCAVLNTDFRSTQYLFKLSAKDQASISIVTSEFDRNLMADAIGC